MPTRIAIGSEAWFVWLHDAANRAFSVPTPTGAVTVRREHQGQGFYWYAYRRNGSKLRKTYVGKGADLTLPRLRAALQALAPDEHVADEPTMTAPPLHVQLLGTPQFQRGEQPISVRSRKAIALLAYLALQPGPQRREHLLALLWPESGEEAARKNLRNVLWSTHGTLGENVLLVQGETLALAHTVRVDVHVFEQRSARDAEPAALREALDLYRGCLLDGLHLTEAAPFDMWLTSERERLTQRFNQAAEALIGHDRTAGAWDAIVGVAERVVGHDPLQEWPYRVLMEAHARRGNRTTALRHYEVLRVMLNRELDLVPEAATEAVHDAIVRGTFEHTAPTPVRTPLRMNRSDAAPFVAREAERGALDTELSTAVAGTMRMVVLRGEMGIGKSRLWQAWAANVGPGVTLLEARCLESTQPMPFAPIIALWSHRIWQDRFRAVASPVPPGWLEDLAPLLPTPHEPRVRPLLSRFEPEDDRRRVFEAFAQALQAIAAPPLVLFLDDVQWADATTLDWLDYLAHRSRDLPMLLVLAYRTEDAPPTLLQCIAQWDRERFVRRIGLERLTAEEGAALLGALGVQRARAAQVYEASAGNPYFLTELAQAPPDDLPPALADLVRARLAQLPDPARQVLQTAAVLEPTIDAATIWHAGYNEDETLDALDTLLRAGMLSEQEDRYVFTHPFVATLVREDLSRARRATLHRRAATALEHVYADRIAAQAGRIMAHFREAGDSVQAGRYAELAGDYALLVAAPAEAAAFYRQAIAVEPTAARELGLGRAHIWQGDLENAAEALQRALALYEQHGDRASAAWAALQLADVGTMRGQFDQAMQRAEQALALADDRNGPVTAAAHVLIGSSLRIQGAALAEAEAHIAEAIRLGTALGLPDVLTYCYVGLSNIRADQGDMLGAFGAAEQIVRYARESGNDFYEAVGYNNAAHRALLLGDYAAAHRNVNAGLELVETRALEVPRQWLYSTRGELALSEHAWDEAEHWLQRGITQAERNDNLGQIAMYHANLGLVARGRDDLDAAIQWLEQAREETSRVAAAFQQAQIDLWLAETYARQDNDGAADRALSRVEARLTGGALPHLHARAAAVRAQLGGRVSRD